MRRREYVTPPSSQIDIQHHSVVLHVAYLHVNSFSTNCMSGGTEDVNVRADEFYPTEDNPMACSFRIWDRDPSTDIRTMWGPTIGAVACKEKWPEQSALGQRIRTRIGQQPNKNPKQVRIQLVSHFLLHYLEGAKRAGGIPISPIRRQCIENITNGSDSHKCADLTPT